MTGSRTAEDAIRRFLADNFPLVDAASVDADCSLVEAGVIDSTGVLELVDYVEATFSIRVSDEELVPENFDSIAALVGFLARKSDG